MKNGRKTAAFSRPKMDHFEIILGLYLKISLETVRTGNKIIVLQEILGEKKS
jgi:hypothetical protein